MGVNDTSFRVGELTAAGLPDASVEAVLCTDAIQFPDRPAPMTRSAGSSSLAAGWC